MVTGLFMLNFDGSLLEGSERYTWRRNYIRHKRVKSHKANLHDIYVTYYLCVEKGCGFKTKQGDNLLDHKRRKHGMI